MSDESIKPPATSNNSLAPGLSYVGNKIRVKIDRSCLKQDKITFTHGNTTNIYIVYEIRSWPFRRGDFTLGNALFGAVENADKSKYKYLGYGIGFDNNATFLMPNGGFGKNVTSFGADMSSSVHIDNKKKIF